MKRSKLVLIIVFLALLAAVVWMLATRRDRETLRSVFDADSTAFYRVEIANADTSITFAKQDGRWRIILPIEGDVEEFRFRQFFEEVLLGSYSAESVATGREAPEKYALTEDKALRIKAFGARDELLGEVWFGDPGNPTDYLCYQGETEVFQTRSKVVSNYRPEWEYWCSLPTPAPQADQPHQAPKGEAVSP